jgi:hypothetical protein
MIISENRVLRKIFGPKREEIRQCRKLHKENLHEMYSSLNISRAMKLRRMRREGHVTHIGGREARTENWCLNLKGRGQLEALGVDGRIILKWSLKKSVGRAWTGLLWLRIGVSGGLVLL